MTLCFVIWIQKLQFMRFDLLCMMAGLLGLGILLACHLSLEESLVEKKVSKQLPQLQHLFKELKAPYELLGSSRFLQIRLAQMLLQQLGNGWESVQDSFMISILGALGFLAHGCKCRLGSRGLGPLQRADQQFPGALGHGHQWAHGAVDPRARQRLLVHADEPLGGISDVSSLPFQLLARGEVGAPKLRALQRALLVDPEAFLALKNRSTMWCRCFLALCPGDGGADAAFFSSQFPREAQASANGLLIVRSLES